MPSPATVFNAGTGQWVAAAAITDPTGGATVDSQARTATNSILAALRTVGVIAGATAVNIGHSWNLTTNKVALNAAITDPSGGATVDTNCRTTIVSVLTLLRRASIIAGGTDNPVHGYDATSRGLTTGAAIADVAAGGTTDTECRAAVNSALAAMRTAGLIAN